MELTEIIDAGLKLQGTVMRSPYGPDTLCLEILGKQFALFDLSKEWDFYNVKSDPALSLLLRDRYDAIRPAFHMNKVHWNSIDISSFTMTAHSALLAHAYMQTIMGMPKKKQIELFGSPDNADKAHQQSINTLTAILL